MNPVNLSGSAFQGNVNRSARICIGVGIVLAIAGIALNNAAMPTPSLLSSPCTFSLSSKGGAN